MISKLMVVLIVMVTFVFSGTAEVHAQKPSDAIESAQSDLPGIQTDLLEVKRMSDNTIRVRWRWRNTTNKEFVFPARGALNETYLLDPVNKKKHFVVTDANSQVIGSLYPVDQVIVASQAMVAWAKFPAPPSSVGKIVVVIAKTPPFEDITIAK